MTHRVHKDNRTPHHKTRDGFGWQPGNAGFYQCTPVRTKFFCNECTHSWKSNGMQETKPNRNIGVFAQKREPGHCPNCGGDYVFILNRSARVPRKGSAAMKRFKKYWIRKK